MVSAIDAQQLLREGRVDEAEQAFQQLLELSPNNVEALNVTALLALRKGQSTQALELLQRALHAVPGDPMTRHHLGVVYEELGDFVKATAEQQAAVQASPEFHIARLYLGRLLEKTGHLDLASIQYARALQDAQSKGRWLNPDTTPVPLRESIENAVLAVRAGREAAFRKLWEPLSARFGAQSLLRVEKCLRIYLNLETPQYSDPRQEPSFLFFPDLPTAPYLDRTLFPWIEALQAQASAIKSELLALLPSAQGRERVFTSAELENANLRGVNAVPTWNGYYFYRHGEQRRDNCESCPTTAAALATLPLSHVRDHGPEVLFSVFTAGTHLLPHRGVTNTRVVGHLPLIIPSDCALSVADQKHVWREGEVVVFDDTYLHEAWNRSNEPRVVLIFDVWNPYLTEVERIAVADLTAAIGDFRHAVQAA